MEYRKPPSADPDSLREAIRRARLDDAERAAAMADLRAGALTRLRDLNDALAPVFAQLPAGVELFDNGVVPGERPRLFVDMIAFVEMGADTRRYRFVQDTRWGQRVMMESDDLPTMQRAVTDYIAMRLVEREKALASDSIEGRLYAGRGRPRPAEPAPGEAEVLAQAGAGARAPEEAPEPAGRPQAQAPQVQAPQVQAPQVQAAQVQAAQVQAAQAQAAQAQAALAEIGGRGGEPGMTLDAMERRLRSHLSDGAEAAVAPPAPARPRMARFGRAGRIVLMIALVALLCAAAYTAVAPWFVQGAH